VRLPKCFSRSLVHGNQKASLARTEVNKTKIFIKGRRRAITPDMSLFAQVSPPQLPALQVVTEKSCRAKPSDDTFAIGHRRRRAACVCRMCGFLLAIGHSGLPEQLAIRAVKTHQRPSLVLLDGLCDEHPVFPHDRCGIAPFGESRSPTHALGRTPVERQ